MDEASFSFEDHKQRSLAEFREIRGLYEDLAETARRIIAEALGSANVSVHSIQARAKALESFAEKASKPSSENPDLPKYPKPLEEITDLAGVRVITFLPRVVADVCRIIEQEFVVAERKDKAEELMDEGKFGYQSIHFLVRFHPARVRFPEYKRFSDLIFEIQVRTILQHAWAEMEHDIQYKSASVIPVSIRRRFIALAGLVEIADREFQALQDEDEALRVEARTSVQSGHFSGVEVTPDALKAYLDKRFGVDGRQSSISYNFAANHVKRLGFTSIQQVDDCIRGYDDVAISKAIWGTRQGQIVRFEETLLAAMGDVYTSRHPWAKQDFWAKTFQNKLEALRAQDFRIGNYDPLAATTGANEA